MSATPTYTLFTDGGSRGNPGHAAAGGVILDEAGVVVGEVSSYLGVATNNVAEYRALILTMGKALTLGVRHVRIHMDSELVVKQMQGKYRVNHESMKPLHAEAKALVEKFDGAVFIHVRRELNAHADRLANEALDARSAADLSR